MSRKPLHYKHNRLQQLRGFVLSARSLSISKAAEKMYLSQPSVSLQIKALERDLGAKLFERRGPRITLTHDGETLLKLAKPLVDGIDDISRNVRTVSSSARARSSRRQRDNSFEPFGRAGR